MNFGDPNFLISATMILLGFALLIAGYYDGIRSFMMAGILLVILVIFHSILMLLLKHK